MPRDPWTCGPSVGCVERPLLVMRERSRVTSAGEARPGNLATARPNDPRPKSNSIATAVSQAEPLEAPAPLEDDRPDRWAPSASTRAGGPLVSGFVGGTTRCLASAGCGLALGDCTFDGNGRAVVTRSAGLLR